ncbi:hypothetical protein HMH01_09575 [Halovulum dunhuangense]|uniref:Lipoprotein n=1 Tax=Halovulum dunhuangense TaxID=1505036 RepID=A0A849L383_9RHOB|nr:hypothetical protein [Halovulum dunhuangense]NNU80684.1 hypothetical protein [Halovulum dunhuangense]
MRRFWILCCLGLAACASPLEQCVSQAQRDHDGLLAAIAIAEANIARGYGVDREVVPYQRPVLCTGVGLGTGRVGVGLTGCSETRFRTVETPVPLDIEAEQRKLASMRARLPVARARRDAAISACYAQFPA